MEARITESNYAKVITVMRMQQTMEKSVDVSYLICGIVYGSHKMQTKGKKNR